MIRIPAIRIEQPMGVFFAVSLSAEFLLKVCYTIRTGYEENEEYDHNKPSGMFNVLKSLNKGSQRETDNDRIKKITRYTETVDACFPNSIILGANYTEDGRLVEDPDSEDTNDRIRWRVEEENGSYFLVIPTEKALASIIDGQHRLFGFKNSENKSMHLLCSVYLDLPMPYHAQIFASINMNQVKVDKNRIYNLFQFQLESGSSDTWSPETLAVYFARVLSEETTSPLNKKIRLGISADNTSSISMASIVDGILSLLTNDPKKDREIINNLKNRENRSRNLLDSNKNYPLRALYLENQDKTIFDIVLNYFKAVEKCLWKKDWASREKFLKTLGISALFDVLKEILKSKEESFEYSSFTEEYFISILKDLNRIDFNIDFFGIQTKLKSRLKNTIFLVSKIKTEEEILNTYNTKDIEFIKTLL